MATHGRCASCALHLLVLLFGIEGNAFLQDEIINVEHILLQTLRFDLTVTHAYQFVCEYAKIFTEDEEKSYVKGLVCCNVSSENEFNV